MAVNSFTSNQGTQSALLTDNTGGVSGTLIPVMKISTDAQGTFTTLWNGNVGVSSGTITTGSLSNIAMLNAGTISALPNIPGGTVNLVQTVSTIAMVSAGTISSLPNIPGGTLNNLGTLLGVGTVTNLGQVYNAGTLQGGTINTGTVVQRGNDTVDLNNNSTGTLAANGSYVGTSTDTLGYSAAALYIYSDQSSATNGVRLEFSSDGTNWNDSTLDTFTAGNPAPNDGNTYLAATRARYYRAVYVNGTVNQTAFRLNTVLRANPLMGDIIPVSDVPDKIGDHAMLTKASIVGKTTAGGGVFVDVKVNPSGALQVDPANGTVQISAGTINLGTFNMASGTLTTGSLSNVAMLNAGTISTLPNLPGGTLNLVQTVSTISMLSAGTISSLPNLPQGSIQVTAGTISAGTINTGTLNAGTVNVGTIFKGVGAGQAGSLTAAGTIISAGSQLDISYFDIQGTYVGTVFFEGQIGTSSWFAVNAITPTGVVGTLTTGNGDYMVPMAGLDGVRARVTYSSGTLTYNNRASNFFAPLHYSLGGTIGNIGMLNAGTISTLPNIPGGTINLATVQMSSGTLNVATISSLPNLPQGSINVTAGTISTGTVNTGTINVATITAGTINAGTFRADARTTQNIVSFGTNQVGTAAIAATIVGSASVGAGTSLWVNNFSIMNPYGSVLCVLGFGTAQQGTNVLFRGVLGTQTAVGIQKSYSNMVNAGMTNQDLVLSLGAAGTVDLSISYLISA